MNTIEHEPLETEPAQRSIWMRGVMMILFTIFFAIAETVLFVSAVVQFFWALFNGTPHQGIMKFGREMAEWVAQVVRYQTFETEERPFPWAPWPTK